MVVPLPVQHLFAACGIGLTVTPNDHQLAWDATRGQQRPGPVAQGVSLRSTDGSVLFRMGRKRSATSQPERILDTATCSTSTASGRRHRPGHYRADVAKARSTSTSVKDDLILASSSTAKPSSSSSTAMGGTARRPTPGVFRRPEGVVRVQLRGCAFRRRSNWPTRSTPGPVRPRAQAAASSNCSRASWGDRRAVGGETRPAVSLLVEGAIVTAVVRARRMQRTWPATPP